MGSSAWVFIPLMALWAVILVPMWLRSHDAAVESKSVDRFSTAMRTLSRRPSARSQSRSRDLLVPAGRAAPVLSGGRAPSATARRERAAKMAKMRRRRTGALVLLGFLAVMVVATALGAVPMWLPLLVLLATAGYGWNLRTQAIREARIERRRRRNAPAARESRPATRQVARESVPVAPVWPLAARSGAAHTEAVLTETVVLARADNGWDATPVVLPTYVTAPPATAVPRVIDLTHPGSWSAAHMLDAAANLPDPDEIFDGRSEAAPATAVASAADAELFDQYEAEHQAVAETVEGSTARPFLDDDAVFDQTDDEDFLALLDRRASGS